jgi:hypothetical protein
VMERGEFISRGRGREMDADALRRMVSI